MVGRELDIGSELVASIATDTFGAVAIRTIRKQLANLLLAYMRPERYAFVKAIPKALDGRLDWTGLPEARGRSWTDIPYAAPGTDLESEIVSIWAEVLDLPCVGRDDHFLDLGGFALSRQSFNCLRGSTRAISGSWRDT